MTTAENLQMITWILGVFSPLIAAGIAWLIRNSVALSERVAVMDSKLSGFVTTDQLNAHSTEIALVKQQLSALEKRVEAVEHKA